MFKTVLILLIAANTSQSTIVTVYQPGHMHVLETVNGSCWTDSIAVQRTDAFRCMSGNTIHDPCFISGKKSVACPEDLLHDRGTKINLTAALPASAGQTGGDNVWALQLASGALCRIGTGTITPGYPYYCSAPPVCSEPKRSSDPSVYETNCGKTENGMTVTSVRVEKVSRIWK